jgi:hypothetical protein
MSDLLPRAIALLRLDGERWHALGTGLDRDLLARQPAPGEWSALQCLVHSVNSEAAIFATRVRNMLAGGTEMQYYDPDKEMTPVGPDTDPAAVAEQLRAMRAESLALLATVSEADLGRTARHSELGMVTLGQQLNEWVAHDLMHVVQAERAVMQAFIPATGPWRPYFADHDVDAPKVDVGA